MGGSSPNTIAKSQSSAGPDWALRVADLKPDQPTTFTLEADAALRASMAEALGVLGIRKLRLRGALHPLAAKDWELRADLGATVIQSCVITLDPVTTRIDEPVRRSFLSRLPDLPEADEMEIPQDEDVEQLAAEIDLVSVAQEALALALPAYPQKDGASLEQTTFADDGVTPLDDAEAKPFAGLASLKDKLSGSEQ